MREKQAALVPRLQKLEKEHGSKELGANVSQALGGMRGICGLVYEPSLLDAQEGIRFRGLSIPECQQQLPKAANGTEPLPEAMLWLLLTGEVPSDAQTKALNAELQARYCAEAVSTAQNTLKALPSSVHPMTQYGIGIMALQSKSQFAKAYAEGKANKTNFFDYAIEDTLDCIARTPTVAAMVYHNSIGKGVPTFDKPDASQDWTGNFTKQLGFDSHELAECLRLYLTIHVDHEGGNVSAHTTTLVGSALSDPYLSYAAGMCGLAGPLHGLANQEVLGFLLDMQKHLKAQGTDMTNDEELKKAVTKYTWDEVLNKKRVVPGYGHAVLRKTDPRYTCQREFAARNFPQDPLFKLVDAVYSVMPGILTEHGKTKNPFPNVDAHSGVLLQHYGLTHQDYYTVLFGVSRQIGVLAGLCWDRLLKRPIERPKSITSEALLKQFNC